MSEFYFQGFWRMDWGFGNPNKTAAFIVSLMIAIWGLAYIRRWGFWIALFGFTVLGVCLVHTYSRGGLFALLIGLTPLITVAFRFPRPGKLIASLAAVCIIVGTCIQLQSYKRLGQGILEEDRSISNRLMLWSYAATMMCDAPNGWGHGNSGQAYTDWYQPLTKNETYRTLVNSHLTWLVELGWVGRFFYLTGWFVAFLLCLPGKTSRWLAIPLGVWIAFFVSSIFSSVAEEPLMWLIPVILLISALIWRSSVAIWPKKVAYCVPTGAAAFTLLIIFSQSQNSLIHKNTSAILFGGETPTVWVVVDKKVLGSSYGRTLRRYQEDLAGMCIGFVGDFLELPDTKGKIVVLTGQFVKESSAADFEKLADVRTLLIVNPTLLPQEVKNAHGLNDRIITFVGDFSQSAAWNSWSSGFKSVKLEGVGEFVPEWPKELFIRSKKL